MITALYFFALILSFNQALASKFWRTKAVIGAAAGVSLNPYLLHMSDTEENREFWLHYLRLNRNSWLGPYRFVPTYALEEKKQRGAEYKPPPQQFQYNAYGIPKDLRLNINSYDSSSKSFPLDEAIKKHQYSLALNLIQSGARSSAPINQLLVDLVKNYHYPCEPDYSHARWVDYYHEQHYLILALYRAAGRDKQVLQPLRNYAQQDNHKKLLSILDEIDDLDRRWP